MAKVRDDLLDRVFKSVEVPKRRINFDYLVAEQARQALIVSGVKHFRLANCGKHALRCYGIDKRVTLAGIEILLDGHFLFARLLVTSQKITDHIHKTSSLRSRPGAPRP